MNIVALVIIISVIAGVLGFIIKALVNMVLPNNDGVKQLTLVVSLLLMLLTVVYSVFNYLGVIDEPIKQGVFRESVIMESPSFVDLTPPEIEIKHITDRERYEQAVKRLDQ